MNFDRLHDEKQKTEVCVLDIHSSMLTNVPYNVGMILSRSMNIGENGARGKDINFGVL